MRNFPFPFIYSFIQYWFIHPCVCPAKAQCPLWPGPALTCRKGNQGRRKTAPPPPEECTRGHGPYRGSSEQKSILPPCDFPGWPSAVKISGSSLSVRNRPSRWGCGVGRVPPRGHRLPLHQLSQALPLQHLLWAQRGVLRRHPSTWWEYRAGTCCELKGSPLQPPGWGLTGSGRINSLHAWMEPQNSLPVLPPTPARIPSLNRRISFTCRG